MKRTIISAVILILSAMTAAAGFIINNRTSAAMTKDIDTAVSLCKSGDTDNTLSCINGILGRWESDSELLMLFSNHDKTNEIDEALRMAKIYAEGNDPGMVIAECDRAKTLIIQLRELEFPRLHNIL